MIEIVWEEEKFRDIFHDYFEIFQGKTILADKLGEDNCFSEKEISEICEVGNEYAFRNNYMKYYASRFKRDHGANNCCLTAFLDKVDIEKNELSIVDGLAEIILEGDTLNLNLKKIIIDYLTCMCYFLKRAGYNVFAINEVYNWKLFHECNIITNNIFKNGKDVCIVYVTKNTNYNKFVKDLSNAYVSSVYPDADEIEIELRRCLKEI